jgi:peroxiredoxin
MIQVVSKGAPDAQFEQAMTIVPLKDRLDAMCVAEGGDPGWDAAYDEMMRELNRTGFLDQALVEGQPFPAFMLPNAEGSIVSLPKLLLRGPVIISFFRGQWCPFCCLMLEALSAALPEIEAAGASLLALTPETGGLPLAMKTQHSPRLEVLCDVDCGVGLAAGIIFRVPRLYREKLRMSGINFPERHGNAGWFLPVPATYIVGQDGMIAWRFIDVDITHRAEPADIIQVLRRLASHG